MLFGMGRTHLRLLAATLALTSLAGLAGCGANGVADVRVINLSPQNGAIDAFSSQQQIGSSIAYGTATSYAQVSAEGHTIAITPASMDNDILTKQKVSFTNLTYTTVIAVNPGSSIAELVLNDINNAPNPNDFALRLVNVSPSSGAVDFYVTTPSVPITGIPPTLSDVPYLTAEPYLQLLAGSYEIRVTPTGTKTVISDSGALTFGVGTVYSVLLGDSPNGGAPYQLYVYQDANFTAGQ